MVKWRNRVWIIGFYNASGDVLESLLALGPDDMEPRVGRVERYVALDFAIGERIAHRLALEDLCIICGEKSVYRLDDAQTLQKRQWSKDRYISEMDVTDGYSPDRMLHMLRLRAQYLNAWGATLNNPHIPKRFFSNSQDRTIALREDNAEEVRAAIRASIRSTTLANATLREIARNRN